MPVSHSSSSDLTQGTWSGIQESALLVGITGDLESQNPESILPQKPPHGPLNPEGVYTALPEGSNLQFSYPLWVLLANWMAP